MKRILTVILLACLSFGLYAQNNNSEIKKLSPFEKKTHHALGFVAGRTAGLGLAYRFYYNNLGFQAAFLPLKNSERELYNVGLSVIYTVTEGKSANLIVMQSNMYVHESVYEIKDTKGNIMKNGSETIYWNHGLGIGVATSGDSPMRLYISGGYGSFKNFEEIDFTVDAGIFYHF